MLNVLLIENNIKDTLLERALDDGDFDVLKIQNSPAFLTLAKESKPNIIIFNIDTPSDNLISDLHTLDQQYPLPIIMFASYCSSDTITKLIKAEISALIINGLIDERINSIIQIAIARFKQKQILKDALEEARTLLEDRKQIDRAKAILIKTQNFTEDVAYHTLRKLAMDRNITLGEMAKNVIAMAELLK